MNDLLWKAFNKVFPQRIKAASLYSNGDITAAKVFDEETFAMPQLFDVDGDEHPTIKPYSTKVPAAYLYSIKNGKCILGREEVFTKNNRVVAEITAQKRNPKIGESLRPLFKAEKIRGTVATFPLNGLEDNYYHYVVEHLARFYIFAKAEVPADYYVIAQKTKFQQEFAELLGIEKSKVIQIEEGKAIQADVLLCPSLINNWQPVDYRGYEWAQKVYAPSWLKGAYRLLVQNLHKQEPPQAPSEKPKRVYISRGKARFRKILNEQELEALLRRYGFESFFMEDLSVKEQIVLFENLEYLVAPHGAGIINCSYCQNKLKLLEIFPQYYHDADFAIQAAMLGHDYSFTIGRTEKTEGVHPQHEDIFVNIDSVKKWLDKVC